MDFSEIMKQANKLQDKMKSAKENIENIECVGSSGGGLVNITLNGNGELKKIDIESNDNDFLLNTILILSAFFY